MLVGSLLIVTLSDNQLHIKFLRILCEVFSSPSSFRTIKRIIFFGGIQLRLINQVIHPWLWHLIPMLLPLKNDSRVNHPFLKHKRFNDIILPGFSFHIYQWEFHRNVCGCIFWWYLIYRKHLMITYNTNVINKSQLNSSHTGGHLTRVWTHINWASIRGPLIWVQA